MPDRFRVYTSNIAGGASLIDDTKLSSVRFKELVGDGISLTESSDSITLGLGFPTKPQVVATRCHVNTAIRTGFTTTRSDLRVENRHKHYIGPQAVSQLQLAQVGYYLKNDATGEHNIGNNYTWESSIEISSPQTNNQDQFTPGNNLIVVKDANPLVITPPVTGFDFAAGSSFYVRQAVSVDTPAYNMPISGTQSVATDTGFLSASTVSQINTTGSIVSPTGGTSFGGGFPALILGIPAAPMCAVCIIGDSIADGTGDLTPSVLGSTGYISRGLESVGANSYPIPYGRQTIGGDQFAQNIVSNRGLRKRALWPYFTHVVCELGTNDISSNGSDLAAMQTFVTNLATSIKNTIGPYGKPLKTAFCTLMPRTSSTDLWATGANQTPVTGFTVGGTRDTYNTWLKSQAGTALIDYVIDVNPYVEDPATHGAWISTGANNYATTDGVHPSTAVHILAAQAINAWALTITP